MARAFHAAALAAALALGWGAGALAAEVEEPEPQSWPHTGPFGTYDKAALQRGLQVYTEVCRSCHSLDRIPFRALEGIGYSEEEVKAYAAQFEVEDGPDEEGDMFIRAARPYDHFVPPFPNDNAARAVNNGALPPDLSLITKARPGPCVLDLGVVCLGRTGGEDYLYALLTGYEEEPPEGVELRAGMSYNPYFPGGQIAMPLPLFEDAVEYADGTEASVEQMARDVTQFLAWAAEPTQDARKRLGFKVMAFLVLFTGLLYFVKRRVWERVH